MGGGPTARVLGGLSPLHQDKAGVRSNDVPRTETKRSVRPPRVSPPTSPHTPDRVRPSPRSTDETEGLSTCHYGVMGVGDVDGPEVLVQRVPTPLTVRTPRTPEPPRLGPGPADTHL